ncbi:MAG: hypothetical protein KAG56_03710 [Sulfurovaceae bacterium]|nr:hypothetical protein [Sulfurovaceae bacterium]
MNIKQLINNNELHIFVEKFTSLIEKQGDEKLETMFSLMDEMFLEYPYKYINYVVADTSRGFGETKQSLYNKY